MRFGARAMDDRAIVRLPSFSVSLDAANTVEDVLRFKAEAVAIEAFARDAKNMSLAAYATEWHIRAIRKLGQMMAAQKAAGLMSRRAAGTLSGRDSSGGFVLDPPENDRIITQPQKRRQQVCWAGIG